MIPLPEKAFVGGSLGLIFFSMRYSAIYEQEIDFKEHDVGRLCVVWSHGHSLKRHVGAYRTPLCGLVCILFPQTKFPTCP
jgi:hypothetical protein